MRTLPLPPPGLACVMQDLKLSVVSRVGCFLVFEFWVLRFRDFGAPFSSFGCFVFDFWVLRFRFLGASLSRFGCFVFESWVLRASVFVFECFVFETTDKRHRLKEKVQKNAQFPFCGQTKAFRDEIVFRGINLVLSTVDQSAWLVLNQPRQRGF